MHQALHAPRVPALQLQRLLRLQQDQCAAVSFVANSSLRLMLGLALEATHVLVKVAVDARLAPAMCRKRGKPPTPIIGSTATGGCFVFSSHPLGAFASQLHPGMGEDIVLAAKKTIPGTVAIGLEFIDLVVPIARIREAYPGGWDQCQLDYAALVGRRVWYDDHLFRDGAMDPSQVRKLVEGWAVLGFEPTGKRHEGLYWKDVCVVDWRRGGPTAPCDWLAFDRQRRTAHLAGTEPGPLVWRGRPRLNGSR